MYSCMKKLKKNPQTQQTAPKITKHQSNVRQGLKEVAKLFHGTSMVLRERYWALF